MHLLEYPVTRPIRLNNCWKVVIVLGAIIWTVGITFINIVAIGYELVPFTSTSFNAPYMLWYERIMPSFSTSSSSSSSWIPKSRSCDPSIIRLLEAVSTDITGFFTYILIWYTDSNSGDPVDGLKYEGTTFNNCTVESIDFYQPISDNFNLEVSVACNTSQKQWFDVRTGYNIASGTKVPEQAYDLLFFDQPAQSPEPLNITAAIERWGVIVMATMFLIAPAGSLSLLLPSVAKSDLSSIHLQYYDWPTAFSSDPPAGDHWSLYLVAAPQGKGNDVENYIPITFLPTGEIDLTLTSPDNLENATRILSPTQDLLRTYTQKDDLDVLKFFNWIFISFYWIFLADFGQISPTLYGKGDLNFSMPIVYPPTNNIFVNETLFEIYYNYMLEYVVPLLQGDQPFLYTPEFSPLNDTNRLQQTNVLFLKSYSCVERQLKGWVSAAISVLVANYALINGPYIAIITIGGWIQRPKDERRLLAKRKDVESSDNDDMDVGDKSTRGHAELQPML